MTNEAIDTVDLRMAVGRYVRVVQTCDLSAFIAVFTDDCEVVDPHPSTCHRGTEGLTRSSLYANWDPATISVSQD